LTLHASKGLEFPVVFIVGIDDGFLPLRPWIGADVDHSKECCLMFVGMTRSTTPYLDQRHLPAAQSPFLSSIDRSLLDLGGSEAAGQRRRRPAPVALQFILL
jgi:superfamily I DNA/RNA helicase